MVERQEVVVAELVRVSLVAPGSATVARPPGMLRVVAPSAITADRILYRNSGSERPASSGENSISLQPKLLANLTAFLAISTTSSGVLLSLVSM